MLKKPKVQKISVKKSHFKLFIHLNFILGILYALYHFLRTPKSVDMDTRRLWASETWIVCTLYAIFIYLFSLETASENGKPIFFKLFRIRKYIRVKKPSKDVIKYFNYIVQNPKKYSFKTHKGIFPVKGNIATPKALFETKETFLLFPLTLTFETIEKTDKKFAFRLIKPFKKLQIEGEFVLEEIGERDTNISLVVYSETKRRRNHVFLIPLFIFPIRIIISRQITKELKYIAKEIQRR